MTYENAMNVLRVHEGLESGHFVITSYSIHYTKLYEEGDNPFEGKRNKLTPNQIRKRRRMMKFVKKKS